MPPLENIDKDFSLTFPLAVLVAKLKSKLENTLLWNAINMTPSCGHAISSSTALFIFLQITPKYLALTMDKILS